MARPERNNVDYFPFICEEGNKMFYIEETYGNDGFATFVKILRELAKSNYHYLDVSKITTQMYLSAKCKISKETLLLIISDLVDLGKFDKLLWNENKIIWCQDFIDSIQDAYFKRKNKCITYDGLLLLLQGLGVRKLSKSRNTVPDNTQSIVEDSIEEESKLNTIPDFLEFKEYAIEKKPNVCLESLKLKYESWKENKWQTGGEKSRKIKNWKSTLLNTLPHLKTQQNGKNEPTINRQTPSTINQNLTGW